MQKHLYYIEFILYVGVGVSLRVSIRYSLNLQAGWFSDDFPDGIISQFETTNLYTTTCVVKCIVNIRKCLSMSCKLLWTGEYDSIFRLSHTTCAGYEIGMILN